ncbi:MAG: efflux transporter periplasmic adaptor subunit [Ignavibacteria bacterium CG2_30_36_16]|nr:MAG: efflux transporter periplasmic adaptor subunit [Ignavibacteria bacterium CG2_30_36_16]PJA98919.1 MAG: efflux RND transporter periplasmic adaptor subunit [Ignavibacteria bacterium CG_4_9_14_3_um_filter_36_18]
MANGKKKSKKKIIVFSIIGVIIVALVLLAFFGGNKEEIISVQTEKVEKRNITQTVTATGKINPEFKVIITPEVTGEIVSLPVKEGDNVKKGTLLLRIKSDAYVAQREKAEAMLQSSKASLSQRDAELTKVEADYNRAKELHSKGLSSDSELESAKSIFISTRAMYQSAQANVMQSEANLRESTDQLSKTAIYSPMDGTITQLNVELGERVLGSGFSQGTNIMTVSDLGNMEATVDVDENDVVLISIGDTANVKVDAFSNKVFRGTVTQIGNSAQSAGLGTQDQVVNFGVRIKLIDSDINLRPGMSCTSDIQTETKSNVFAVPIQSVTARDEDKSMNTEEGGDGEEEAEAVTQKKDNGKKEIQEIVFVVKNGKAKTINVETGISDDNYIEIKSGLSGGEDVVSGSYRAISRELKDGVVVRVEEKKKTFGANKN